MLASLSAAVRPGGPLYMTVEEIAGAEIDAAEGYTPADVWGYRHFLPRRTTPHA